jgi:hypothetical protein
MNYQVIESKYISKYHGMESLPRADHGKRFNENGVVLLAVYMCMKKELTGLTEADKTLVIQVINNLRTYGKDGQQYKGLFDRGAKESLLLDSEELRTISHDNITAIAVLSELFGLQFSKHIYEHGSIWKWRFDNAYPEKPRWSRIMHFRDIIYWTRLGGSGISKAVAFLTMPIFYLTQILACSEVDHIRPSKFQKFRAWLMPSKFPLDGHSVQDYSTGGKQMAFIRLYPLRKKSFIARMVWKLCTKIVESHGRGGMPYVFKHYYANPRFSDNNPYHPIIEMAYKLKEL